MEWNNRGGQTGQPTPQQPATQAAPVAPSLAARKTKKFNEPKWLRGLFVALLFSSVILAVAAIAYGAVGTGKSEASYVDDKQMQAVFLNGGQVYFGNIKSLNNEYLRMDGIYYLRVNQQVQPNQATTDAQSANDISLVKLGCELHGPQDQMVINREQVIFWENLKPGGQVAKAVEEYVKQNPGEQKCDQTTGQSTTPTTQTQATTPTTTTPTTTTTPKKP